MCDFREALSERREQVRPGLEPVLVEVPRRALAGPEHEVTLEQGVLDEQAPQAVRHGSSASDAICTRRSSSGVPGSSDTADPSA